MSLIKATNNGVGCGDDDDDDVSTQPAIMKKNTAKRKRKRKSRDDDVSQWPPDVGQKTVPSAAAATTTTAARVVANECKMYGPVITVNSKDIISSTGNALYVTDFSDYTLITDCDFTNYMKYAPASLKEAIDRNWVYVIHVSPTVRPIITRATLQARNVGGDILAYQYNECSLEGNDCVYYGFVPAKRVAIPDTHTRCIFSSIQVWPRKLYVQLKRQSACMCSDDCTLWSVTLRDHSVGRFCVKQIPWDDVHIMMGGMDEKCVDAIKAPRQCLVCAQCVKCRSRPTYCRTHRKCRHKKVSVYDPTSMRFTLPSMKNCKYISGNNGV